MGRRVRHLNPASAGAIICIDADRITGVNDNTPLDSWPLSGSVSGSISATTTLRPLYRHNAGRGCTPCVVFDGVDDYMTGTISAGGVQSAHVVVRHINQSGNYSTSYSTRTTYSSLTQNSAWSCIPTSAAGTINKVYSPAGPTSPSGAVNGVPNNLTLTSGVTVGTTLPFILSWSATSSLGSGTIYPVVGRDTLQFDSPPRALGCEVFRIALLGGISASLAKRLDHSAGYRYKLSCS